MLIPAELSELNLQTLKLNIIDQHVLHVEIASNKVNSMTKQFWSEYRTLFHTVSTCSDIRVVVVSSAGMNTV